MLKKSILCTALAVAAAPLAIQGNEFDLVPTCEAPNFKLSFQVLSNGDGPDFTPRLGFATGVLLAGPFGGAVVQRASLIAENFGDGKSFVAFIGNDKVNVFTGPDCDSTIGICVRVNDVAPESIENLKFLFSASENLQALGLIIAYSVKCGCLDDTLPGLVEFLDSVIENTGFAAQADALSCGNKRLKPGKGPFGKL